MNVVVGLRCPVGPVLQGFCLLQTVWEQGQGLIETFNVPLGWYVSCALPPARGFCMSILIAQ